MISTELRLKLVKRLQKQRESEDIWRDSAGSRLSGPLDVGVEVPTLALNFSRPSSSEQLCGPSRLARTWKAPIRNNVSFGSIPSTSSECHSPSASSPCSRPSTPVVRITSPAQDQFSIYTNLEAELESLEQKIMDANMERDKARQHQQHIEAASVAGSIELGAEVAKLRVGADVLQRELRAIENGLSEPRQPTESAALANHTELDAELVKARSLEQEIAESIIERVRLEGLLRQSNARELQARRHLDIVKKTTKSQRASGEVNSFALDQADDEDAGGTEEDLDDLEFAYEDGLELSRLMPIQQALELVRRKSERRSIGGMQEHCALAHDTGMTTTAASSSFPSGSQKEVDDDDADDDEDEAAYAAPLRALELALLHLRAEGPGEGARGVDAGGKCLSADREADEVKGDTESSFDAPLADLTQVLLQLSSGMQAPPAEPPEMPRDQSEKSGVLPARVSRLGQALPQVLPLQGSTQEPCTEPSAQFSTSVPFLAAPLGMNLLLPYATLGQKFESNRRNAADAPTGSEPTSDTLRNA